MHGELAVLQRVMKFLDEGEATDRLLMHAGREDHVMALALGLRFIEGDVRVANDLGGVLALSFPDHYTDTGALLYCTPPMKKGSANIPSAGSRVDRLVR